MSRRTREWICPSLHHTVISTAAAYTSTGHGRRIRTATASSTIEPTSVSSTARSYASCPLLSVRPTNRTSDAPPSNCEPHPVRWMSNQPVGVPVRHPT